MASRTEIFVAGDGENGIRVLSDKEYIVRLEGELAEAEESERALEARVQSLLSAGDAVVEDAQ